MRSWIHSSEPIAGSDDAGASAGASAADGVAWGISAGALANDDAIDTALGTEVIVTDVVIAVGDFVEVIAGDNSGALARIIGISGTTVTIDRSLFASTSTARVRYLRFIDLGNIANVQVQSARFIPTIRSEFIQFLVEFRGTTTSPRLESLIIDFKSLPI